MKNNYFTDSKSDKCLLLLPQWTKAYTAHSGLWLFPFTQVLSEAAAEQVATELKTFLSQWQSHGTPLLADAAVLGSSLLMVVAQQDFFAVSGCGKDALFKKVADVGRSLECSFFPALTVVTAAAGSDDDLLRLTGIERHDLRAAACDGRLQPRTLILRRELSCLASSRRLGLLARASELPWLNKLFTAPA